VEKQLENKRNDKIVEVKEENGCSNSTLSL